jgi:UDP-2,4-diacetamido-2,4,6-trideoxy-beta-L-altropyranose hydrolase
MVVVRKAITRDAVLFRCDATAEIGAGHATRCLALAEALEDAGWRITFVVNEEAPSLVPALAAGAFKLRIIDRQRDEIEILRQEANGAAELLVLDHYQRDARLESACRPFIQKILVLDDATGRDHDCDILVDSAAPEPAIYAGHVPARARVLTGPVYALMRRAFVEKRPEALGRRDDRPVKEILVSFGATDPSNATSVALAALEPFADDISIVVALSSRAQHLDDVRRRLRGRMRLALDAEMAALMTEADLAIGAAGVSSYERAVLGLPSIIVTLARNQCNLGRSLIRSGAAVDAGALDGDVKMRLARAVEPVIADCTQRMRMAQAASALADGQGALRVVAAITQRMVLKR